MYYNDQIIVLRGNDGILKEHIMALMSEVAMDTFYKKIEAEQWVIILLLMICVIPVSLIVVFNSIVC